MFLQPPQCSDLMQAGRKALVVPDRDSCDVSIWEKGSCYCCSVDRQM